jgi:hypothetical protein
MGRRDYESRNVLVLTPTSIRVFTATGRGWPPEGDEEVGAWPVNAVKVAPEAAESAEPAD